MWTNQKKPPVDFNAILSVSLNKTDFPKSMSQEHLEINSVAALLKREQALLE
jgi:hypothetical protein